MILTNDYPVPTQLLQFGDPFLFMDSQSHVGELCWYLRQSGVTCFSVRGKAGRTIDGMFNEFIPALQFPSYCGQSWGAFNECLNDLANWVLLTNSAAIVMSDADQVMADDPDNTQFDHFVGVLAKAAKGYAVPDPTGPVCTQRPAIPFHLVLDFSSNDGLERWRKAGASLVPLDTVDLRKTIAEVETEP